MSTGDMIVGGLGLLVGLVGVVAYAMGFKAGMSRAFDEATQALKEAFKS
jgi:Flp pilus assembly pilin Flp